MFRCTLLIITMSSFLAAEATLEQVQFGSHISGPELSLDDLRGRVVLIDAWGVNCPPCRALVPHISELAAKYDSNVFRIVAAHSQGGSEDKVIQVWKSCGGSDDVTIQTYCTVPGEKISGLPDVFLFDHQGKLLFHGYPKGNLDQLIADAVALAPGALVSDRQWQHIPKLAYAVGRQQATYSAVLKKLHKMLEDEDLEAGPREEAEDLLTRITNWAQAELDAFPERRQQDPIDALERLNLSAKLLKGDDLGDAHADLIKSLKKDKAFKNELKAAQTLAKIKAAASKAGIGTESADPSVNTAITKALDKLIDKYPDTPASEQAETLRAKWGL